MHKRTDKTTAADIDKAISMSDAAGVGATATHLYSRCVPIWIALRVLVKPGRRRPPDFTQPIR